MSATEAYGLFYWVSAAVTFGVGLAWWGWFYALGFAVFWPVSWLVYLGYWVAS